jgi:hypothetical protein
MSWRDHVREMSYDMENCIDDFMHNSDGADAETSFIEKMAEFLATLGRRHQIASRIEELSVLSAEANVGHEMASVRVMPMWLWIHGSLQSTRRRWASWVLTAREKSLLVA